MPYRRAPFYDAITGRHLAHEGRAVERASEYAYLAARFDREATRAYARSLTRVRRFAVERWQLQSELFAADADRYRFASERLANDLAREEDARREREREAKAIARGDRATEWEIGLDYAAQERTSNVTTNVRFRRRDGQSLHRDEALAAIGVWVRTGRAPSGIEVLELGWSRRLGATLDDSTIGDDADAVPLAGPMIGALSRGDFRLGAVSE